MGRLGLGFGFLNTVIVGLQGDAGASPLSFLTYGSDAWPAKNLIR